jgi:DNA-binding Xre family transcriptional regulator
MKWNLRLTAAHRGIWKASDLQHRFAEHGLVISAGKMSGLWSGQPVTLRLSDLDVTCVVLDCQIGELMIPEQDKVSRPTTDAEQRQAAGGGPQPALAVVPRRRDGRSLPPA